MYTRLSSVAAVSALILTGCVTPQKPASTQASPSPTSDSTAITIPPVTAPAKQITTERKTFSSFDQVTDEKEVGTRMVNFENADLEQVLDLYESISKRTIIYSPRVNRNVKVTFRNSTSLSQTEVLQTLDTILAAYEVVMVYVGDLYVKACAPAEAPMQNPPLLDVPWRQLPKSMSFVHYMTRLKKADGASATSMLQPFAHLPNSIIASKQSNLLILRDYSANVRRMMEVLEQFEDSYFPAPQRPNK